MDIAHEHDMVPFVNFEHRIFLPGILPVAHTGSEQLRKALAGRLCESLHRLLRIKGGDESLPVVGINKGVGIFFHQGFDALSGGKQILPRGGIEGADRILLETDEGNALKKRVDPADEVVQIPGVFGLRVLGEIGDADQHAVFIPRGCHAAGLDLIVLLLKGNEHPAVLAGSDRVHQVHDLIRDQVIGLGLAQHLLCKDVEKHAGAVRRLLEGGVAEQHPEAVR